MNELRQMLAVRIHGDPEKYYYVTLWENMVIYIQTHLDEALAFIESECTDEELFWLGEIFDDILAKTKSKEFLNCLQERAERVENPEWKKDILTDIHDAAAYVE